MKKVTIVLLLFFTLIPIFSKAQHSVARDWNEELLGAIRNDFARPTVHARNLFHSAVVIYDAWALFDDEAETFFLGKSFGSYTAVFNGIQVPADKETAIHEVMSYAMYRLLNHRFVNSPGVAASKQSFSDLFTGYGYDKNFISTDYSSGSYAALGNYLANEIIAFGLQDGSNEQNDYANE